jgi:hypothetical protein
MLWDQLKPPIRTKCWGLSLKGVTMLHNNIHPHTAAHTTTSNNWTLRCWSILIWLLCLTITCSVHSKTHGEAAISPVTNK